HRHRPPVRPVQQLITRPHERKAAGTRRPARETSLDNLSAFAHDNRGYRRCIAHVVESAAQLGRGGAAWGGAAILARSVSHKPGPPSLGRVAGAVWGSFGCSVLLARVVDRDRPCHDNPADEECPDGPSFPSDQAAAA